ncbi:hypothetical protein [Litoribacter populi]|uniref:hypothetical protein n=1 Tax=Litoribacter populi TaxID=2598460 RepID=UPI00117D418E|nr:hypothetical protein [Litoribacter populi]
MNLRKAYFLISLLIVGCNLQQEEFTLPDPESDKIKGVIKLNGGDLSTSETPLNGMIRYQEVYGFSIKEIFEEDTFHYANGVARQLSQLELDFIPNRKYILQMSYVRLDESTDLSLRTTVFGNTFSDGIQNVVSYKRQESQQINPFITNLNLNGSPRPTGGRYPESDKFVGEAIFEVAQEPVEIEIEMFRLSGMLNFRILNLEEGKVDFLFKDDPDTWRRGYQIEQTFTPTDADQQKYRPALYIPGSYEEDLIHQIRIEGDEDVPPPRRSRRRRPPSQDPIEEPEEPEVGPKISTEFEVTVRHITEEDGEEVGRNVLIATVSIFRNESITYELDLLEHSDENSRRDPEFNGWTKIIRERLSDH